MVADQKKVAIRVCAHDHAAHSRNAFQKRPDFFSHLSSQRLKRHHVDAANNLHSCRKWHEHLFRNLDDVHVVEIAGRRIDARRCRVPCHRLADQLDLMVFGVVGDLTRCDCPGQRGLSAEIDHDPMVWPELELAPYVRDWLALSCREAKIRPAFGDAMFDKDGIPIIKYTALDHDLCDLSFPELLFRDGGDVTVVDRGGVTVVNVGVAHGFKPRVRVQFAA